MRQKYKKQKSTMLNIPHRWNGNINWTNHFYYVKCITRQKKDLVHYSNAHLTQIQYYVHDFCNLIL